jgi:prepilin signal peptidase PulO-like enzyme (type II secretory pathway)
MPLAAWMIVVWLLVLGAVIGSFLNVVVWRLPQGGSLIEPPSHCPKCKHPIRWYDNVPVVGWFLLRGRCRDCRAPISFRYPLVEALCAAAFFLLALLECALGGVNLPQRPVLAGADIVVVGWSSRQLYGIFLFHALLWCTILAGGLIEIDGNRPGWRVYAPALTLATVAGMAFPWLHPVPAWQGIRHAWSGPVDTAAGVAAGAALGWLLSRMELPPRRQGVFLGFTCLGLVLGWQAAVGLAVVTLLWQLFAYGLGRWWPVFARIPTSLTLVATSLLWIAGWAHLVHWVPWLG